MSSTKSTESLKDSECKKGQLAIQPPISYVPPTDLHSSTESETIKVKLPRVVYQSYTSHFSGIGIIPPPLGLYRWYLLVGIAVLSMVGILVGITVQAIFYLGYFVRILTARAQAKAPAPPTRKGDIILPFPVLTAALPQDSILFECRFFSSRASAGSEMIIQCIVYRSS